MYANGVATTEKETSDQRLARYLAEYRQRFEQAKQEHWTGDFTLVVNLSGGHPAARAIGFVEKSK